MKHYLHFSKSEQIESQVCFTYQSLDGWNFERILVKVLSIKRRVGLNGFLMLFSDVLVVTSYVIMKLIGYSKPDDHLP